ncbi:uncharacterized protein LOC127791336 [Diospyros lotus]|uniref:uncharacterized protein LOC127791336 n=1 Tax=Diospyros lotus TaxID=55363 RepID=UPI0022508C11|nr:uncharacterized protein LOC127791336 [Diospyros lotus]
MTTIEKLFVQIFERKDRIIEEIQRQSDLYSQHLASKLLIQGIAPPPWLWNPSFKSLPSDPGELKKEELISEFLRPHPQPPVPYIGVDSSRYSRPVVIGDNGELSEGLFMETQASNKGFNGGDKSTAPSDFHDNNTGYALNCVPESDPSVSSPERQVDAMISNIYTAPDQSLARIQRSKSRQKALELRKSAKGAAKSDLVDENDSGFHSSGIRMSGIASRQLNHDYEFWELAKRSDTINDSGALRLEIGECQNEANMYCGRSTGCRSSYNVSAEKSKYKELDNCSNISKKDGVLRSESTRGGGISKPVSLFNSSSQRITRSKSTALKMSQLESSNRLEGLHLQNVPSGEVIQHCPEGIPVIFKQEVEDNYVAETELISDGSGEAPATCSNLDAAGLGVGLDVFVSRQPSDRSMFVRPKTLEFDDMEKGSLNEIFSQRPGESSEKMSYISLKSPTSLDKTDNSSPSKKCLEKQSREHVVSDKTSEAWRRSFGSHLEECVIVDKGVPKSNMNKNLKNFEDNSEAIEDILHYPASLGADVESLNFGKSLDVEGHQEVKYHSMEGSESSSKLQVKECELACDGDRRDRSGTTPILFKHQQLGPCFISNEIKHVSLDKVCLVEEAVLTDPSSSVLDERQCCAEDNQEFIFHENELNKGNMSSLPCIDRTLLQKKGYSREDGFLPHDSVCSLHCVDKNFNSSEIKEFKLLEESLIPGRKLRSAKEKSWPQFKRRKIEDKPTDFFSASPRFRVKEVGSIGGYTTDRYLNRVEDDMEPVYKFQCHPVTPQRDVGQSNVNKSSDMEMAQKVNHSTGSEPSPEVQLEVDACTTTPTFNHGQFGPYVVSSSIKEAAGHSECCSIENGITADATSIVLEVRTESDEQNYISLPHFEKDVALENKDDLVHDNRIQQETLSLVEENGFISNSSFVSLHDNHLGSVAADQTLPEFEGFVIDTQENAQPHFIEDAFNFEKLDLPRATIERVSALEQLCKSAIVHTPLSQFSTTFKLHRTLDPYQSVPNGLLEHMNLTSTLNIDDDCGKNLRASCSSVNEVKCSFQGLPNSSCMPLNGSHFGWSARKPPMSPVGRLWDRISSNSSSSEKQRSLNPELTCFPIEEDPSFSEENENGDEVADTIHKNIHSSLMNHRAQREPLAEVTETYANCLTSVSMSGKYPNRCSLDSISTEVSLKENNRVKQKLGNCPGNKSRITNEDKRNHSISVSMNGIKEATESLKNRFSKPKLSGKTSLRKDGQNLSEREPKRNNIVSNITSFVPLVQKKQEATVGTGKRNIKVKALEAAEAAKRLQEKRENERKMKKEALKLEKAKVEKENLRQMELKKKRKEEEQKKKDASMAERKRLREEEERKEKERKRKRTEEAWQQRRERKENLHIQKVEKDVPFTVIDEEVNSETKFIDDLKKQKKDEEKGDDSLVKKPHTESATAEILENNVNLVVLHDCEAANCCSQIRELTSVLTKTNTNNDLEAKASQEKSYEISPYQCSDDEDDEEDEIPTKKFIPSWASKSSVAVLLSSQEKIDPAMIFPPESFCHINEVLRPRK